MRTTMRRIALLLMIIPLGLSAQNPQKITLDDAIKKGLEQSKLLKYSEGKIAVSNAKLAQYKAQQLPNLNLSGSYSRISDNIKEFEITLPGVGKFTLNPQILNQYAGKASASETVFAGLRTHYGIKSAEYLKKATELDFEKDKSDIVYNIVNAYYNLYKVRESLKLVQQNIQSVDERVRDLKKQLQQGVVTENDVSRSQLERSNFDLSKIDIDNNIKVANYNMTIMLGLPAETDIIPDSASIGSVKTLEPLANYFDLAMKNRADVKANEFRTLSSATDVKVSKSGYYPVVNVGFNYLLADPNQRVFPQQDKAYGTWDAGIQLNYNITGAYVTHHQVQEATARLKQTEAMNEQLNDQIKMEINQGYVRYVQSLDRIKVSAQSVQQAESNFKSQQSRMKNGTALTSDVLEADVLLLQAKLNVLYAKADAEIAYQQLLRATGTNSK